MTVTKYEHACLLLEKDGSRLAIDPGMMTKLPDNLSGVVGIFITHVHGDHLDESNIQKLLSNNPGAKLVGSDEVLKELNDPSTEKVAVKHGDIIDVSPFHLEVFGQDHAIVYGDKAPCVNTAVMVDETLYYPGDSFTNPSKPIEILAVPASAPWMKMAEAMDFIKAVRPKLVFPTHDGVLSDEGQKFANNWLKQAAEEVGAQFKPLVSGESL